MHSTPGRRSNSGRKAKNYWRLLLHDWLNGRQQHFVTSGQGKAVLFLHGFHDLNLDKREMRLRRLLPDFRFGNVAAMLKVSAIVPCYKREHFIARTIGSIFDRL